MTVIANLQNALCPHAGPQRAFLATSADVAVYGGAAGGGKSLALLMEACRHVANPGYSAIIFRRTYPSLRGAGALLDLSRDIYIRPRLEGTLRESPNLLWSFPSGAKIQFSHLQHEKNILDHRGREYAFIGFDEITEFTEAQFWGLLSRNRTTCGIRPYLRATCNPDPDHFVRGLIDWYVGDDGLPIPERSGVLRWFRRKDEGLEWFDEPTPGAISFTFIAARLVDNPTLMEKDPDYQSKLQTLPKVDRERLLGGNWNIKPVAGSYFRRYWFEVVDEPPTRVRQRVRAWDLAGTAPGGSNPDPDWTVGVRYSVLGDGRFCIEHAERDRVSSLGVERMIVNTAAADGIKTRVVMWQDPGQARTRSLTTAGCSPGTRFDRWWRARTN